VDGRKAGGSVTRLAVFSEEIGVICLAVSGRTVATGHRIPIVNLWRLGDTLMFHRSLLGHLSPASVISIFPKPWKIIAVGHEDGTVSLFSRLSYRFLRALEGEEKGKVTLIRMAPSNGDLLIGQRGLVTLRSINGELIKLLRFERDVIDATFTSYSEGTCENLAFLLTDREMLMLRAFDFEILRILSEEKKEMVSIALGKGDKTIVVSYSDGTSSVHPIQ
jgi:WD40 repeat protein